MRFNRSKFFESYRKAFGHMRQLQVDGLEFLLGKIESDREWESIPQLAYFLATIKHETGISRKGIDLTFQPTKELRGRPGTQIRAIQDKYWSTNAYGRGFVQITWPANYSKFGLGPGEYDKALEPETAYLIAARGMREGMFTGKKLSDYINGEVDYVHARKIVNGLDRANDIAEIAEKFERILKTSLVTDEITEAPKVEEAKPGVVTQEPEPPAAPQASKPEVTPVSAPSSSITTKVAAAASAAGPVIAATGLKIGGVEFKTGGLVAFAAVLIVGMVISAWIWNQSQERALARQRLSMENLASDNKGNVIAAGSKV